MDIIKESQSHRRSPAITYSTIELEVNRNIFHEGGVRLSCVATIFNLYQKEKHIILEDQGPKPRPSSVLGTRDSAAGFSPNITHIMLIMTSIICSLLSKQ